MRPRAPRHWPQVVALLLFISLLAVFGWFYLRDEPPPNDSDLSVHLPPISDEQNGLVQLRHLPVAALDFDAFAKSQGVTDEALLTHIREGATRKDPLVDAYLAQAQPVFVQLDRILALPHFENTGAISAATTLPDVPIAFAVAQALRLEVIRSLQKGDYVTATKDTLRLRQLASRLTQGYTFIVQYLNANAIYGYSALSARELLNSPGLPATQLVMLANAYASNAPSMAAFQRTLAITYQIASSQLAHAYDSPSGAPGLDYLKFLWNRLTLKPNATRRELVDFYTQWGNALHDYYADIDFSALDAHNVHPNSGFARFAPNSGGHAFLIAVALSPEVLKYPYWEVAVDRLLRTGYAMRVYYVEHGALPPNLETLVPDYLPALPTQPHAGQPFHYDAARALIYSVGTSLKDTGGSHFAAEASSGAAPLDPLMDLAQPTLVLAFQNQK